MEVDLTPEDFEMFMSSEKLDKAENPDSTPYQSKYEARVLLEALRLKLNVKYIQEISAEIPNLDIVALFAFVLYKLGVNHFVTDERSNAEKLFDDCLKIISPFVEKPQIIHIYISTQNYLSFINSDRSKNDEALQCLQSAQTAYNAFKQLNISECYILTYKSPKPFALLIQSYVNQY